MALVSCPKCSTTNRRNGFPAWTIILSIIFFPIGLFALFAGRKPTRCHNCGFMWQT